MNSILTYINGSPVYRREMPILPKNKALLSRARSLRKAGVLSEVIFWKEVHKGKFHHIDFDRQRIIGNYIVDFYIKSLGLVIEIDGTSHNGKEEYDEKREVYLKSLGLNVYRISDLRVKHDLMNVMTELEAYLVKEFSGA